MKMKGLTNANNEKPMEVINKEYIRVIIVHSNTYDIATAAPRFYTLQMRCIQSKQVTYAFKRCIR